MRIDPLRKQWRALQRRVPEPGEHKILCEWVRDVPEDAILPPMIDMKQYRELCSLLPDKIVENLNRGIAARDGRAAILTAGLGYVDLLGSVIVDGTPVANSSTEAFLFPALVIPKNYLQPNGIPARTMRWRARGRVTTLSTAATLVLKFGAALTNVIPTTPWAQTGAVTMDAAVHTNEQWVCEGDAVIRSVGSGGTVFAQGNSNNSAAAFTLANNTAGFMGSAGSATPAVATVDETSDQFVSLTAKWSLTTAYSITGHLFIVEALN